MENNITPVENNLQQKFSYVQIIKEAMRIHGWNQTKLQAAAGVSNATISRALGGRGISGENLYKILVALNLLQLSNISLQERILKIERDLASIQIDMKDIHAREN